MAFSVAGVMAAALVATTIILLESPAMAAAASHTVGGSTGWTIPPNSSFYSVWSSSQTLAPGDTLVFNFPSGMHSVVKVPKASYDACSTQNQVGSTLTTPPATVTLTSGAHYFICGVPGHCTAGQKLAVTVPVGANTTATPPTSAAAPAPAARSPAPTPTSTTSPFAASSPSQPATPPATSGSEGPSAEGPSSGGSGSPNSASPALRTAGGAVLLVSVAAASLLLL